MRKLNFLLLFVFFYTALGAQELNVSVRINTQRLQTVDPGVFETLEQTIVQFLSDQQWTNDIFEAEERINCNFILTLQEELSATSFKVDLAVQSSRPIFGTDQETPLLNYVDKDVNFEYEQFQPLQFSENVFNDNLSSVLAFYVYIILGLDYDSFSPLGGDEHFQAAQEIINNIPTAAQAAYPGWRSIDGNQNRFWILENLQSPRVRPLRNAWYQYHRLGLDIMPTDVDAGRAAISEVVQTLGQVDQSYPNSMIVQLFLNSKRQEIIEIFKRGTLTEKSGVIQTMSRVDPSNSAQYRKIR